MKKKYINPEMELLEVEELSLLAGSLPLSDSSDDQITGSGEILAPESPWEWGEDFDW